MVIRIHPGRGFVEKNVRIAENSEGKNFQRKAPVSFCDECGESDDFL